MKRELNLEQLEGRNCGAAAEGFDSLEPSECEPIGCDVGETPSQTANTIGSKPESSNAIAPSTTTTQPGPLR